jgi:uncharacterized protein (DUF2062 family)
VIAPIVAQLTQGVTPEKIAFTLALGIALGVFPILGSTTVLCAIAGVLVRLNQPIIQAINYLVYPLQLVLLIPFYRVGEYLLGRHPVPLSVTLLIDRFRADTAQFLKDFGMIGVGGILVWLIVAPIAIAGVYFATRGPLRALARRIAAG